MPEQAAEGVREQDIAGSFRVPPPRPSKRPADPTANRPPPKPTANRPAPKPSTNRPPPKPTAKLGRRAGLSAATARVRRLAGPGPVAGSYMTIRGAMVAMFAIFLFCSLVASWLNYGVLTGLGYVASCALAPFLVRRHAQLTVVIAPPAIFMAVLVITQVVSAQGTSRHGRVLSVLEGTLLTLAAVAPWLFAGTVLSAGASMTRGLRQCVRELAAELRGDAGTVAEGPAQETSEVRKT